MAYPEQLFQNLADILQSIDALDRKLASSEHWSTILTMLEWVRQQGEPPVLEKTGTEDDFVIDSQYHETLTDILRFIGTFDRPWGRLPPPSELNDFRSNDRLRVLIGKYPAVRWGLATGFMIACYTLRRLLRQSAAALADTGGVCR
jgi:hypothetical protein